MKPPKEAPSVDVSRGMPSVNETRKKSNHKGMLLAILLIVGVGGGAAYLVYAKVKTATQAKSTKPAEEKSTVKPRVFAPPAPVEPQGAPGAPASPGSGTVIGGAPAVPPPLGGAPGPAPAEVKVPAIAVIDSPRKPPPIGQRQGYAEGGARASNGRAQAGQSDEGRSRYDTPFVINGSVEPGGGGAPSAIDDKIRRGQEAIIAATTQSRQSGGFASSNQEASKGALSGMLTPTSTPMVRAGLLGNLSLTVRKGTPVECVLSTKIVAMVPGLVKCRLTSPLYSANGKVILADRGSEVVGEQNGTVKQGQTRLYVLWTEIATPEGVIIPIDSPAADALGGSGLDGEVDNRWMQRIGASLMLSLIDDAFAYRTAKAGASEGGAGVLQGTQQQGQSIAEKVLDSTINIPPILYKHQGEKISIIIARHLDFSTVYALEPK